MTPDELRAAIETLWPGHGNQTRAAEYLGVGSSRIREWLRGARKIPDGVAADLRYLLARFPDGVRVADPMQAIETLQRQMMTAGWTEAEAAAGILGAAWGNATRTLGRDEALQMIVAANS